MKQRYFISVFYAENFTIFGIINDFDIWINLSLSLESFFVKKWQGNNIVTLSHQYGRRELPITQIPTGETTNFVTRRLKS